MIFSGYSAADPVQKKDRIEHVHEKTNNLCFQPGLTQTKKRNCTICVAKTKALISFAVTTKLICAFAFAYANCWFSHAKARFIYLCGLTNQSTIFSHVGVGATAFWVLTSTVES